MDILTFLYISLTIIIATCIFRWFHEDKLRKHVNKIPGPVRLPLIGTIYDIIRVPREERYKRAKINFGKFGKISRQWLGSTPLVQIMTAEDVEPILKSSEQITKGLMYDYIVPWLGDGLLTSTGAKWFKHRKLITPTFHFKILDSFMEIFVEKSKLLAEQLSGQANGKFFDVYPFITHCALDIICETAMGVEMNAMSNKGNAYVEAIYGISEIIPYRNFRPWLGPDLIFYNTPIGRQFNKYLATLHNFTSKVINDRQKSLVIQKPTISQSDEKLLGKKKRMAFLDLLIEGSGNTLTANEIREEVDTFMFAGHDTTTAAICWTLFLLGNHLEIQEQVYTEIESVFQGKDKDLTINDLGELKHLERCMKESLRLFPSVPAIGRRITKDIQIGDYLLPTGCTVAIFLHIIHKDEKHFPEPERFDPDRFLPENAKNRHPYAFVPFSAGPRNCIGQKFAMYEEKTMLSYILRKFKVKTFETEESVMPVMEIILRPINGVKILLEPRM